MRLFRPLSWISQSRGNSPVASAEGDGPPMMAPSADVAHGFNSHAAAHNDRVYGGPKRKLPEDTQKRNREITDFFSSSPMGSENSKIGSGPREVKKRKLNPSTEEKSASTKQKSGIDHSKIPSHLQRPKRYIDSSEDEDEKISMAIAKIRPTADSVMCAKRNMPLIDEEVHQKGAKRDKLMRRAVANRTPQPNLQPITLKEAAIVLDESHVGDFRDMFVYQFNLEIKLQHEKLNALRCELARSQIAMEQLRRCHLIPFPQTYADPESMLNIMDGTGPSIPQANGTQPKWASPFGVTEGAYARHYAKWLIPDPRFDGVAYEQPQIQNSGYPFPNMEMRMDGRQTRNSFQLDPVPKNKRRSRGDISQPLQALSSGYAQKKEDAGPSVLKRADGQWVKLVCIDCQRENFGSTQGFINHCRIAHRREFKSHEEAAVNSGHVVGVDQFGGLVGEEKIPASVAYEGLVHHKIKTAPVDWATARDVLKHVNDALKEFRDGKLSSVKYVPGETTTYRDEYQASAVQKAKPAKDFAPAAETPHLSSFLSKSGFNKDLESSVKAAKAPVDEEVIDVNSDGEESDADEQDTLIVAPLPPKNHANSSASTAGRPFFRAPILPSMRPSSSSNNGNGRQTPILPPARPTSREGHVRHMSTQIALAKANGAAQAKKVQAKINSTDPRMPPTPAISQEPSSDGVDDDAMVFDVGVQRGADADAHSDVDIDERSPTAHSEGDKAPSLVSDDDDYTAESEASASDSGSADEEASEEETIEVRDESDEARSRRKTSTDEEIHVRSRVVNGRAGKASQAKRGNGHMAFVSPVKGVKKGRAMGRAKK